MRDASRAVRLTFGSLAIVLALTGCAGSSWQFWKTSPSAEAPSSPAVTTAEPATATPTGPAVATAMPAPAVETARPETFSELAALGDVRFRTGLVTVGKADAPVLDELARWLQENPGARVRIEGHTDDRGNATENLAVGQKRAASVMKYLVSKGLDPERISIVSYGSDRPVCTEKSEACRSRNRRAHFLVKQP